MRSQYCTFWWGDTINDLHVANAPTFEKLHVQLVLSGLEAYSAGFWAFPSSTLRSTNLNLACIGEAQCTAEDCADVPLSRSIFHQVFIRSSCDKSMQECN